MKKRQKINLTKLFLIGVTVVLLLLAIAFTFESLRQIEQLGDFAVKIDEKNSLKIASNLFFDATVKTTKNFSLSFLMASSEVEEIAYNVLNILTKDKTGDNIKNHVFLKKYKNRDFFVDTTKKDCSIYYWGTKNFVPENIKKRINKLYSEKRVFQRPYNPASGLYVCFWVISKDKFAFTYPASRSDYINTGASSSFNKKLLADTNFPLKSTKPFHVAMPKIIDTPYKSISGQTVICAETAVYGENSEIKAWIGVDFNFKELIRILTEKNELFNKISSGKIADRVKLNIQKRSGFLFIITKESKIILLPENAKTLFSIPEKDVSKSKLDEDLYFKNSTDPIVREMGKYIIKNNSGIKSYKFNDKEYVIAFDTIPETGWTLVHAIDKNVLLRSAIQTEKKVEVTESKLAENFLWIALIFLIASCVVLSWFFRHYFAVPVRTIINEIKNVKDGNFDINLKEEGISELAELAANFNYLGKELTAYMKNLEREIEKRHRFETELKLASDIQKSILPSVDAVQMDNKAILCARLEPAKSVSGDFFDFFKLDDGRLAIVVADVVGKGLPAAFFMAMSKLIIKNISFQKTTPAEVLEEANRTLYPDNKAQMFVTVFLGFYDLETGELEYANGGHLSPILIKRNSIEVFENFHNIALGILKNSEYEIGRLTIASDESVILYTDGLTEAVSPDNKEFGEEKLIEILINNKHKKTNELCEYIIETVEEFEEGHRFDDITLVMLKNNNQM